jgi:diamine N-acetyltransferase
MEIPIRGAGPEDYQPLGELFEEIDALHRENLPHIYKKADGPARSFEYYLSQVSGETTGLFLAEVGGKPVGFVHGWVKDTPPIPFLIPQRIAYIDGLIVKAAFQNRGIGRKLVEAFHQWAQAQGATSIELNVYEFNRSAIAFYERLGYHTLSRKMSIELSEGK